MQVAYYLKRAKGPSETAIYARISYNGHQLKYYIPEKINPRFWNKKTRNAKQSSQFPEYPEFNERLKNISVDIRSVIRKYQNDHDGVVPEPESLKDLLNKKIRKLESVKEKQKTFFGFFETIISQSRDGIRMHPKTGKPINKNTLKTYNTTFKHLVDFQERRKKRIDFNTIDLDFYNDYTEFLMKGQKKNLKTGKLVPLNLSTNTIGKHIQIIKLIMNEATERGINTNLAYKSKRFVTVREKSDSIYLDNEEIKAIEDLDLSQSKRLESVRDLFLIGCYTGLRYSDYSILNPKQIKNGFIETTQVKTGEKVVIPIHRTVKKIIDKYAGNLPPAISNQKTNDYLKELGKKITTLNISVSVSFTKGGLAINESFQKWEMLTSHTARRSFATNEYLAGTPTITIMAITGHKTEKSFMRYIKLTSTEHAKILKLHWDKRNRITSSKLTKV
jgi:integrase